MFWRRCFVSVARSYTCSCWCEMHGRNIREGSGRTSEESRRVTKLALGWLRVGMRAGSGSSTFFEPSSTAPCACSHHDAPHWHAGSIPRGPHCMAMGLVLTAGSAYVPSCTLTMMIHLPSTSFSLLVRAACCAHLICCAACGVDEQQQDARVYSVHNTFVGLKTRTVFE